jgi:hypothetical protein
MSFEYSNRAVGSFGIEGGAEAGLLSVVDNLLSGYILTAAESQEPLITETERISVNTWLRMAPA